MCLHDHLQSACKQDVINYCSGESDSKADMIRCLSQVIRNDVLKGKEPSVSLQCRNQVSFELLQRVSVFMSCQYQCFVFSCCMFC